MLQHYPKGKNDFFSPFFPPKKKNLFALFKKKKIFSYIHIKKVYFLFHSWGKNSYFFALVSSSLTKGLRRDILKSEWTGPSPPPPPPPPSSTLQQVFSWLSLLKGASVKSLSLSRSCHCQGVVTIARGLSPSKDNANSFLISRCHCSQSSVTAS